MEALIRIAKKESTTIIIGFDSLAPCSKWSTLADRSAEGQSTYNLFSGRGNSTGEKIVMEAEAQNRVILDHRIDANTYGKACLSVFNTALEKARKKAKLLVIGTTNHALSP